MSKLPDGRDRLEDRFARRLLELVGSDDRATLARLRRGLGKPVGFAPERDGWVIARLPADMRRDSLEAYCLVASLFAMHPAAGEGSMGAAFARLRDAVPAAAPGAERRFTALLNSDEQDLALHLRHAVSLLRAKEVALDWADLLQHVQHWEHPDRWVQIRWSSDFWAGTALPRQSSAASA